MYRCITLAFPLATVVALLAIATGCRSLDRNQRISDALQRENPQTWVETSFRVRGCDYRLCLPADLMDSARAWNPGGGENPKLPLLKAAALAREALAKQFRDSAAWNLDSVELRELPNISPLSGLPVSTGKWYYEIGFRPPEEGIRTRGPNELPAPCYRVFVLLSGIVIEPKIARKVEQTGCTESRDRVAVSCEVPLARDR